MPDKHEVDGSIPFEPTTDREIYQKHIEKYIDKDEGKLAYLKKVCND